jgi:alkanesulfonate monooxygenase
VPALLETLRGLHELGFTSVHATVPYAHTLTPIEIIGRELIPEISTW